METKELSPGKFAVNYGLILGLIMVLVGVYMYFSGILLKGEQMPWPMLIYYIIFPVVIIYAISQYKKSKNNILSIKDALKVGVSVAVISAIVYAIYGVLFTYVIDPSFMDKMLEVQREKLYENPKMTEEMIDKSIEIIKIFSNPFIGGAIWIGVSSLFGLIYSLIGGLVMKKEA